MGTFKEMVIEQEDRIFRELDRLQKSFLEITGTSEYSVLDFPIEDAAFEPDMLTLTLPSFSVTCRSSRIFRSYDESILEFRQRDGSF